MARPRLDSCGVSFPPSVSLALDNSVRSYWLERVAQHTQDSYAGVALSKFPEDLRVYEHLLWDSRASAVIEIGTQFGGSALWFRDRLEAFGRYRPGIRPLVISIDVDIAEARRCLAEVDPSHEETITLLEADVRDPTLSARVGELVPSGARCLVVEDSAHIYDTTLGSLKRFARFVPPGGYFVVEDGCVDIEEMRLTPDWPRGVLAAVHDWLQTSQGAGFTVRRDLELYGISCHPEGYLQRRNTAFAPPEVVREISVRPHVG
jgi:cephalosporin hydroxylase